MEKFDTWFARFMWGTDIVFLAASTPHIAAWYAHFDNPTDPLTATYAWAVGFGLAIAIDGVSLMLLFALTRMIKQGKKNAGAKVGILFFMAFIAGLSWLINWQYDTQFASTAFSKADAVSLNFIMRSVTVGRLNPIIGGAFNVLILAYALIGNVIKEDDKPAMTDEQFEEERKRIERERALRDLRSSGKSHQGLLSRGKEMMLGGAQDFDELQQKALSFLYNVRELLDKDQEERALEALSVHLNIKPRQVLPLLIQARAIIQVEDQKAKDRQSITVNESLVSHSPEDNEQETNESSADNDLLNGRSGRDTVSIEEAAKVLACQPKHILSLRNDGKLKRGARNHDRITVASLRAYRDTRKRRNVGTPTNDEKVTEQLPVTNGHLVASGDSRVETLSEYAEMFVK